MAPKGNTPERESKQSMFYLENVVLILQVKLQLLQKGYDRVHASQKSYILIAAEELATLKDEVYLQFSGYNLDKKDWFGKSDPFLEIHKSLESGDYSLVHKTEVRYQKNCLRNFKYDISLRVATEF